MKKLLILSFMLLMSLLAACAANSGSAAATCAEGTADRVAYKNEADGYCLLYPADYTVVQPNEDETVILVGDVMNHMDPRFSITVTDAAGRSTQEVADALTADYAPAGFDVNISTQTVAGEEAVILDNLPGQDINRRVVMVHNGRIYSFFITPLGEDLGERAEHTEALYQTVMESFSFLP